MFIVTVFLACSFLWIIVAIYQFFGMGNKQVVVPEWAAKICGSKSNYVDPGLFSLQIFALLVFLWSVPTGLIFPQSTYRGVIFWRGTFFLLIGVSILFLFFLRLSKRE